jgi:hypothetical protein
MDGCTGIFTFNRDGIEDLWGLHCDAVSSGSIYFSGIAEKPHHYSMLRCDVDQKELTDSKVAYELYSIFDALNLIKEIQAYLQQNIDGCQDRYLHCALLTKDPYLEEKETGVYNKHGYHLQFVNCFLSKGDNSRLAEHFHRLDPKFDKVHNHPWLLYGSQKNAYSGSYSVSTVVLHNGTHQKPEEYFSTYKIYNSKEEIIQYTKPISWYYPRIFSIIAYNRDCCDFKPEVTNFDSESKKMDYNQQQANFEDAQEHGDKIQEIILEYISEHLDDALQIQEATDRGFKLKNTGTFTCPIDPTTTHSRLGAFVNMYNGAVYFGCYKCRDAHNRCTTRIGQFKELPSFSQANLKLNFREVLDIPKKKRTKEQNEFLQTIFTKITKRNVEYLFNVQGAYNPNQVYEPEQDKKGYRGMTYKAISEQDRGFAEWMSQQPNRHAPIFSNCLNPSGLQAERIEINTQGYVSKDIIDNCQEKAVIIRAGLGKGKTQASTDHINEEKYDQIVVYTPRISYARCCLDRLKQACPRYDWRLYLNEKKGILQHPYVICQAESLHRLDVKGASRTLILIDEVEAFLCQLTSKLHRENHVRNIETFIHCMKTATKVVCLDAFISQRTLQTMKLLKVPYKFYDSPILYQKDKRLGLIPTKTLSICSTLT